MGSIKPGQLAGRRVAAALIGKVVGAAFCISAMAAADDSPRAPLPDSAAIKLAESRVQDAYGQELANHSAVQRLNLATKLLAEAKLDSEEPAVRYVELMLARDFAAAAGDLDLAFRSCQELDRRFAIDLLQTEVDLAAASTTTLNKTAVQPLIWLSADALQAARYPLATQAASLAAVAAAHSRDALAEAAARDQARAVDYQQRAARAADRGRKRLVDSPNEPEANLLLGKYLCIDQHEWSQGLPLLSKGPDMKLRAVVEKDLGTSGEARSMANTGDLWLDLSETDRTLPPDAARDRAAAWYRLALPALSGIDSVRVRTRLLRLMRDAGPTLGMHADEWKVLCWNGSKWAPTLLDKMSFRSTGIGLGVKNTTGIYTSAFLVYNLPIEGDFNAAITIVGNCDVLLVAATLNDSLAYCVPSDDRSVHTFRMSRQKGEMRAIVDDKSVQVQQYNFQSNGPCYFGIALPTNAMVILSRLSLNM